MPWGNDKQRKYEGMFVVWYFKPQFHLTAYIKRALYFFSFHNTLFWWSYKSRYKILFKKSTVNWLRKIDKAPKVLKIQNKFLCKEHLKIF